MSGEDSSVHFDQKVLWNFRKRHKELGLHYFDLLNMKSIGIERSIEERMRDYFS